MSKTTDNQQKQQVVEAIEQAEQIRWTKDVRVQLNERMSTKLCVDLLSYGILAMADGKNAYRLCTTPDANPKEYLKRAKGKM